MLVVLRKVALLRYLKPVTPKPQQKATELPASNRSTPTPSRKTRGEYTRLTPSEKAHEKLNPRKLTFVMFLINPRNVKHTEINTLTVYSVDFR